MKKFKRNIAFLLATMMTFGAIPTQALAATRPAVPHTAIPSLVHGNVPFATNGTRFVSHSEARAGGFLNAGPSVRRTGDNANAYQPWRYLRLDFTGTSTSLNPWGNWLGTPETNGDPDEDNPFDEVIETLIGEDNDGLIAELQRWLDNQAPEGSGDREAFISALVTLLGVRPIEALSTGIANYRNPAHAAGGNADTLDTLINEHVQLSWLTLISGTAMTSGQIAAYNLIRNAFVEDEEDEEEYILDIPGQPRAIVSGTLPASLLTLLNEFSSHHPHTPALVGGSIVGGQMQYGPADGLNYVLHILTSIAQPPASYAWLREYGSSLVTQLNMLLSRLIAFTSEDSTTSDLSPVTFVIPLVLQHGEWLTNQGFTGAAGAYPAPTGIAHANHAWLRHAANNARWATPYIVEAGQPAASPLPVGQFIGSNSHPASQIITPSNDINVEFIRETPSHATLYVTINQAGVMYVPMPAQLTNSENNLIVGNGGLGVSVYSTSISAGRDLGNLNANARLVTDRALALTAANGTIAQAQAGYITNTTIPSQGNGRNSIGFNLRIAELVPHHRFGSRELGFHRGTERIAFELVAPAGFSWPSTGFEDGISIDQQHTLGLAFAPFEAQAGRTQHTRTATSGAIYGPATDLFYIYRASATVLRFVERPQANVGSWYIRNAATNVYEFDYSQTGRIVRTAAASPHNVRAQIQFNGIRLVHNSPAPAQTTAEIAIRNIPAGAVFNWGQGGTIAGGGGTLNPNDPNLGGSGVPGLPGAGTGGTQQPGTIHTSSWGPYVASVRPQSNLVVGTVGPHGVTLETLGEIPTLISGRLPIYSTNADVANAVSWQDVAAARVRVSEVIPLSLWSDHQNLFEVTEGVRIERVRLIRNHGGSGREHPANLLEAWNNNALSRTASNANAEQAIGAGAGGTLTAGHGNPSVRINHGQFFIGNLRRANQNHRLGFEMDIYLNIPANFEGPINLYFEPIGHDEARVETYVTIANAVRPIEVETDFTNIRVGYQFVNVGGFTISENEPGALLVNEELFVSLTDFVMPLPDVIIDNSFAVNVSAGDIELSRANHTFDGRQHLMGLQPNIVLTVDRASTVASTIEFTQVRVRSLNNTPLSNVGYDLVVWGPAVVQNFQHIDNTLPSDVRGLSRINGGINNQDGFDGTVQAANQRPGIINNTLASRSLFGTDSLISELFITLDGDLTGAPIVNEVVTISASGSVTVGGQPFSFNPDEFGAPHVNANGVAVLPARMALSILFGADPMDPELFVWDSGNSAFYVDPQGRNIRFQVNNTTMWVGGVARQILSGQGANAFATAAYVDAAQNSRLFVPLRAIAESVGFDVDWNASTSTVTLTPPNAN